MPADLTQLFDLARIAALPPFPPLGRQADYLSLGEMLEMLEEARAGLHPGSSVREDDMELSELQWAMLHRIATKGVLPPWEAALQKSAAVLDELGYLVTVCLKSDNLRNGGGFVRCMLTPKGYKTLSFSREGE